MAVRVGGNVRDDRGQEGRSTRLHALGGLGQLGRRDAKILAPAIALLNDADDEVRAQAAKGLGDARVADAYDGLVPLLADKSSRVRAFAAHALGKIARPDCVPQIATLLRENNDRDAYLRHAGVMALTGVGAKDPSALLKIARDDSPAVRMGVLLALRRLNHEAIARFLDDADPNVVLEAARAINDEPVEAAMPALAAQLEKPQLAQKTKRDEMVLMRVLNANYRLGTPEAAQRLARYASTDGANEFYRVDALRMLASWQRVPGRDHIVGLWRPLPERDPKIARDAATPAVAAILKAAPDTIRAEAARLVAILGIDDPAVLTQLASSKQLGSQVRAAAMAALASANDPRATEAIRAGLADPDLPVRLEAIRLAGKLPDGIKLLQDVLVKPEMGVPELQVALAALGNAPSATEHDGGANADQVLSAALDKLVANQWPVELQLDLIEAADKRQKQFLDKKIAQFRDARDAKEGVAAYPDVLVGGDVEAGKKVFLERADVSCLKCHAVEKQGGNAGPDLAGIGGKQTREYLLESILYPQKHIAPGWETVIVRLKKGGDVVTGVLKSETKDEVVVDVPEKGPHTIKTKDIDKRRGGQSAMPADISKTLSRRDMRNLVEYLATLK